MSEPISYKSPIVIEDAHLQRDTSIKALDDEIVEVMLFNRHYEPPAGVKIEGGNATYDEICQGLMAKPAHIARLSMLTNNTRQFENTIKVEQHNVATGSVLSTSLHPQDYLSASASSPSSIQMVDMTMNSVIDGKTRVIIPVYKETEMVLRFVGNDNAVFSINLSREAARNESTMGQLRDYLEDSGVQFK